MGNGSSKQKTIPGDSCSNSCRVSGTVTPIPAEDLPTVYSPPSPKEPFNATYDLSKDLGSGAFSIVKMATHKVTNKDSAVKIISKKKLSEDDLSALMTEISILCELNHPHIIKCYETFDEGNEFYIVTELVAGGELFDRIVAKTHYTEKEARDLVKMFLETMAYMHEAGVVHRDLKPENLLLCSETDDSDIKIADFGFAKKTMNLLPNETACGTPGYVAPEILRGDRYGTEVDIWSMGVICYVLLAGYPPFYDEDQKKLFKKIKEGKYHFHQDYWGGTSPDAMDMIRKMLCVSQADRWSARQLLSHPWITAGDDELQAKDLTKSIEAMKKYKAKMRFKAVTNAIIMTNRMKGIFKIKKNIINGENSPQGNDLSESSSHSVISNQDTRSNTTMEGNLRNNEVASNLIIVPGISDDTTTNDKYIKREKEVVKEVVVRKKKNMISAASVRQSMIDEISELEEDMSHMTACID